MTTQLKVDHDHQVKDHQKMIPYDDVIDISHSEGSGEKEVLANQEAKTLSNDEGTYREIICHTCSYTLKFFMYK